MLQPQAILVVNAVLGESLANMFWGVGLLVCGIYMRSAMKDWDLSSEVSGLGIIIGILLFLYGMMTLILLSRNAYR